MELSNTIQEKAQTSALFRWGMLILVSLTTATNYYVYDAMSSIKSIMQAQLGFSNADYGLLVSFYSFPNTFLFMAILGGIILDKWGIRKTGNLFVAFCVAGIGLSAYGASPYFHNHGLGYDFLNSFLSGYSPELKMLMLGRLLFGLGAETSIVVVSKIIAKWFKGKELALAFGVELAIARLGTAGALILSPKFSSDPSNWHIALWAAALLMGIGMVCFLIYSMFDARYDAKNKGLGSESLMTAEDEFHFSDLVDLMKNKSFIAICMLCVTFYSAVFPFQAYCPDLLHNKFSVSIDMSGMLTSLIIWGTIIFTPLFGAYVDKKGKRASLMIFGSILLIASHLVLSLTYISPYIAMFALGIAFSLVPAAMWPSVALIVDEKKLGTAYGFMTSIQNVGLWAFPILAGWILDSTNAGVKPESGALNYTWTIMLFVILGVLGLVFAFALKRADKSKGGYGLENAS
jgi:MFS family permease